MSGFDDTWAEASADGNNQDDAPPDGTYDAALIDAGAFTSKQDNDVAKLEFQTVDKQYTWTMIMGFASTKAASFSKGTCATVGVDVDSVNSMEELDTALKAVVGGFFEVKVERNGDWTNTYVQDGIPAQQPDVPADTSDLQPTPSGASDDDDLPF